MDKLTISDLTKGFKAINNNAALIKSASEIKDIKKWAFWHYLEKDVASHKDEKAALKTWAGTVSAGLGSFFGQSLSPGILGALQMITTLAATIATGFAIKPTVRSVWMQWIKGADYKNFMSKDAIVDIYDGNATAGSPSISLKIKMGDLIQDPVAALQKAADNSGIAPSKMQNYHKRLSDQTSADILEFYTLLKKVDNSISALNYVGGGTLGATYVAPRIYDITHGRNPGSTERPGTKRALPPEVTPKNPINRNL